MASYTVLTNDLTGELLSIIQHFATLDVKMTSSNYVGDFLYVTTDKLLSDEDAAHLNLLLV